MDEVKVRARRSYRMWRDLYAWLRGNRLPEDIIRLVYRIMDANKSFGSEQMAEYALESLELVLAEAREETVVAAK